MIRRFIDWMFGIGKLREDVGDNFDSLITIRDLLIEKIAEVERKQLDYFEYWDDHWKVFNSGDVELRAKVKLIESSASAAEKQFNGRIECLSRQFADTKKECLEGLDSLGKIVVDDMQKLDKRIAEAETSETKLRSEIKKHSKQLYSTVDKLSEDLNGRVKAVESTVKSMVSVVGNGELVDASLVQKLCEKGNRHDSAVNELRRDIDKVAATASGIDQKISLKTKFDANRDKDIAFLRQTLSSLTSASIEDRLIALEKLSESVASTNRDTETPKRTRSKKTESSTET